MGAGKHTRIDHINSLPLEEDGKNLTYEKILKAMNDLKSDMGMVKKYLNLSETSKPNDVQKPKKSGWRSNEQEDKTDKKNKFAGMAAKGTKKLTGPSSLSNCIVQIDDLTILMRKPILLESQCPQ